MIVRVTCTKAKAAEYRRNLENKGFRCREEDGDVVCAKPLNELQDVIYIIRVLEG